MTEDLLPETTEDTSSSDLVVFDSSLQKQLQIVRYISLAVSVSILVLYCWVINKLRIHSQQKEKIRVAGKNHLDLRDRLLLVVSFFICLIQFFSVLFFNTPALLLAHRISQILLQCTLGMILTDLLILKFKNYAKRLQERQSEFFMQPQNLPYNKRTRRLKRIFASIALIAILVLLSIIVADFIIQEEAQQITTYQSRIWLLLSIIELSIAMVSLIIGGCIVLKERDEPSVGLLDEQEAGGVRRRYRESQQGLNDLGESLKIRKRQSSKSNIMTKLFGGASTRKRSSELIRDKIQMMQPI